MKKTPPPDKPDTHFETFEPARPTLWASLVFALATLTLSWPMLLGKTLFTGRSDIYTLGYAFRHFAEVSFKSGQGIPQWNPYLQGGLPYIGAMHGDIFYPTFLLRLLVGTAEGITLEFPIHLFLAGLFTFLFLRAWRVPFFAALVGGLAYMLSGSIAGYASPGHDGKLFVSTLLPLGLFMLTRGIRDGRNWTWAGFAFVVGLAMLSPHPQLSQYLLLVSGSFALYLAFATHAEVGKLPTSVAVKRLGFAGGAVVLGLMIAAIQYLPVMKYTPWSPRSAGHTWEDATSYSFPIEETINAYVPQFSGILDNYWGQNQIHFHSDYFGVVVLVLMGAAFGAGLHKSFKRFWAVTALVALVWAWGGHTPLYHLIIYVPYTKYLRAPSMMIYVTAFSVAVLAAIGTERILRRQVAAKYGPTWAIAAGAFAVFMTIGGYRMLVGVAMGFIKIAYSQYGDQILQAFGLPDRAEANTTNAVLGAWRSFAFVALTAGVIWLWYQNRLSLKAAAWGMALLVLVDLWTVERLYWQYMPPAEQIFASDAAIDSIKADAVRTGPGRTLLIDDRRAPGSRLDPMDPYFRKKALMNQLVRTVEGEQGNELNFYRKMMALDSGQIELNPNFWRHENVRYVYAGLDPQQLGQAAAQMGLPPFTTLAGPVRNANGSMVFAYRMGAPNPYAWVAGAAVQAEPQQVLPTVLDPRFDPTTAAVVDTGASIKGGGTTGLSPSANSATVKGYEPGKVSVDLARPAQAGNVLVLSENYYPGWAATSGTTSLTVSRVNYNLIGVELPAGTQHVELSFADPGYPKGKVITWAAVAVAVVLLIVGLVADRRRPAPVVVAA
jgi:hypothetical protein